MIIVLPESFHTSDHFANIDHFTPRIILHKWAFYTILHPSSFYTNDNFTAMISLQQWSFYTNDHFTHNQVNVILTHSELSFQIQLKHKTIHPTVQ